MQNGQTHANNLLQKRQILLVCLAILLGWALKG